MSKSKTSSDYSDCSEGYLVILSAPSGCGKTTIIDRLLIRHPDWVRSVSATTRQPREGEKNGSDYFFMTQEAFLELKKQDGFLESARVFDHHYGTPKRFILDQLRQGKKVLLAIDVQGANEIRRTLTGKMDFLTIFVLPPSVRVLRERLEGRQTESQAEMDLRIQAAQEEIKEAGKYDFTVVNQNLDQTVAEVEDCIIKNLKEKKGA